MSTQPAATNTVFLLLISYSFIILLVSQHNTFSLMEFSCFTLIGYLPSPHFSPLHLP